MDGAASASRCTPPVGPPVGSSLDAGFAPSAWVSAAEFAALRAHPALAGAVAEFAASLIDAYEGNTLLNTLLCDRGRVLVGFCVLYLEVLPLPGTHEVGATLSAIQALCRQNQICSPGRAASDGRARPERDVDNRALGRRRDPPRRGRTSARALPRRPLALAGRVVPRDQRDRPAAVAARRSARPRFRL